MSGHYLLFGHRHHQIVAAILLVLLANDSQGASLLAAPGSGISVELDTTDGTYQVISKEPAWNFGGSLEGPTEIMSPPAMHMTAWVRASKFLLNGVTARCR